MIPISPSAEVVLRSLLECLDVHPIFQRSITNDNHYQQPITGINLAAKKHELFLALQSLDSTVLNKTSMSLCPNQLCMGKILALELLSPRAAAGLQATSQGKHHENSSKCLWMVSFSIFQS